MKPIIGSNVPRRRLANSGFAPNESFRLSFIKSGLLLLAACGFVFQSRADVQSPRQTPVVSWGSPVTPEVVPGTFFTRIAGGGSHTLGLKQDGTIVSWGNESLRLDGINQYGPTGAWFTIDTVALSSASQLYFDVSSIGQPRRLYRVVPVP
jgi:hypothetical protein